MNKARYFNTYDMDFHQNGADGTLKKDYRWINESIFHRALSSVIYAIALVLSTIYCRVFLGVRFVGAKKLKEERGGFFLYGNHTHPIGDVFHPAHICFPKRIYTVVSPKNLRLPVIGKLLPYLGALPTPSNIKEVRKFNSAIEKRYMEGSPIVIYPEAHLWDYYTDVRPFESGSFSYPIKLGAPVYCFTTTYQKRRLSKRPRITVYVDGPFLQNGKSKRDAERALSESISQKMRERSRSSTYRYIEYIKK